MDQGGNIASLGRHKTVQRAVISTGSGASLDGGVSRDIGGRQLGRGDSFSAEKEEDLVEVRQTTWRTVTVMRSQNHILGDTYLIDREISRLEIERLRGHGS